MGQAGRGFSLVSQRPTLRVDKVLPWPHTCSLYTGTPRLLLNCSLHGMPSSVSWLRRCIEWTLIGQAQGERGRTACTASPTSRYLPQPQLGLRERLQHPFQERLCAWNQPAFPLGAPAPPRGWAHALHSAENSPTPDTAQHLQPLTPCSLGALAQPTAESVPSLKPAAAFKWPGMSHRTATNAKGCPSVCSGVVISQTPHKMSGPLKIMFI